MLLGIYYAIMPTYFPCHLVKLDGTLIDNCSSATKFQFYNAISLMDEFIDIIRSQKRYVVMLEGTRGEYKIF